MKINVYVYEIPGCWVCVTLKPFASFAFRRSRSRLLRFPWAVSSDSFRIRVQMENLIGCAETVTSISDNSTADPDYTPKRVQRWANSFALSHIGTSHKSMNSVRSTISRSERSLDGLLTASEVCFTQLLMLCCSHPPSRFQASAIIATEYFCLFSFI